MNINEFRPKTEKEAYEHGKKSHVEGLNPFRNMGVDSYKLNNAWYEGFNSRNSCSTNLK